MDMIARISKKLNQQNDEVHLSMKLKPLKNFPLYSTHLLENAAAFHTHILLQVLNTQAIWQEF